MNTIAQFIGRGGGGASAFLKWLTKIRSNQVLVLSLIV